jgi:phosphoglycolate phosphatase-like HAD superfamily hydrolase
MSQLGLSKFTKQHEFLVAIDSDGCAFDTMEIKHKECFIPAFVEHMQLQAVSKYAREVVEFINLYSNGRGTNRFPAYVLALDMLAVRPEVKARNVELMRLQGLRDWIARETKLGTKTVCPEAERTGDPDLKIACAWSRAVDENVARIVHGVPPFPGVRAALESMSPKADLIVCSATPNAALQKEWEEHAIDKFVQAICGQEVGSKKESLAACRQFGYEPERMLMIGDAPGDMKAAQAVGACFYAINPGHEEESWARFNDEAMERFFAGTYKGEYESNVIAEFDRLLPDVSRPPWKTVG